MIPVVVDASVAVKWFVPEIHAGRAASLLGGRFQLLAPDLLLAEAANTIWKKAARGELSEAEARQLVTAICETPIEMTPSRDIVAPAYEIAIRFGRTVYDSLYVALAVARECLLVTGDAKLVGALAGGQLGRYVRDIATWTPGESESA